MTTTTLPADKFDTSITFVKPEGAPSRVPLDQLAVLPGFNTRVKDAEYNERVAAIGDSIVANGFFDDKPFAVTMLPGDDTVYIYDGEHRFDASKAALLDGAEFPDGVPVAWAKDGATVKDLTIHLAHGNNGERLNMVELAAVVRRMQGLDMNKDEIATALGRTVRHVDNLFVLAAANQTVKKAVASGQFAGAEAVKLLRKDPKTAAAKITEAVKAAAEKGKAKATPKSVAALAAPKGPKMKTIELEHSFPEGEKMGEVLKHLAAKLRESLRIGKDDLLEETGTSVIRLRVIDVEAEAAAEKAAAEKAAAAEAKAAEKAKADAEKQAKKDATTKALAKAAEAKKTATPKKAAAKPAAKIGDKAVSGAKTPARRMARPKAEAAPAPAEVPAAAESTPDAPVEAAGEDNHNGL